MSSGAPVAGGAVVGAIEAMLQLARCSEALDN